MPPRVFIGLSEVAGYFGNLERGFREIGVQAHFIDEAWTPFGYSKPASYAFLGSARAAAQRRRRSSRSRPLARAIWRLAASGIGGAKLLVRLAVFAWAMWRYDVFIFSGGRSFLLGRDMPVLHALGKRVICVFTGTDHRPPYLNGRVVRELSGEGPHALVEETRTVKEHVRWVERHADVIVASSASAQFHSRPFVQFLALGIPSAPSEHAAGRSSANRSRRTAVRILHSPSDPLAKGTSIIRASIERMRTMGHEIDYREITNRPNTEVLAEIDECDFVVDEVFSDTPIGVFATEAASLGKPAVVTGYYAPQAQVELAPEITPPGVFATPEALDATIERLINDPELSGRLGVRARDFVRSRWTPAQVAERYLRLIEGDIPPGWLFDAKRVRYIGGWGLPDDARRNAVSVVLRQAGPPGLQLSHNPALEKELVDGA